MSYLWVKNLTLCRLHKKMHVLLSGQYSFTGKVLNFRITPSVQLRLSVTLVSSSVCCSKIPLSVVSFSFSAVRSLRFAFCLFIATLTTVRKRRRQHTSQSVNQSVDAFSVNTEILSFINLQVLLLTFFTLFFFLSDRH